MQCIISFSDRDAKHAHLPYIVKMPWITMKMAYIRMNIMLMHI